MSVSKVCQEPSYSISLLVWPGKERRRAFMPSAFQYGSFQAWTVPHSP